MRPADSLLIAALVPSAEEIADGVEALDIEDVGPAEALEIGAASRRVMLEVLARALSNDDTATREGGR